MYERRKERRISAICLVYETNGNFLGISLDLAPEGIAIVVSKNFPHYSSFVCRIQPVEGNDRPEITLTLEPIWRRSRNLAYDEIGAKVIQVERQNDWRKLVNWHSKNEVGIKELSLASASSISVRYSIP